MSVNPDVQVISQDIYCNIASCCSFSCGLHTCEHVQFFVDLKILLINASADIFYSTKLFAFTLLIIVLS